MYQIPAGVGEHGMQALGSFRNLGDPAVSASRVRTGKPGRTIPRSMSGGVRSGMGAKKRAQSGN
jgi:hypothetical protein